MDELEARILTLLTTEFNIEYEAATTAIEHAREAGLFREEQSVAGYAETIYYNYLDTFPYV